jgi:hypothetical protein
MRELLYALAFVAILLVPCLLAARSGQPHD